MSVPIIPALLIIHNELTISYSKDGGSGPRHAGFLAYQA